MASTGQYRWASGIGQGLSAFAQTFMQASQIKDRREATAQAQKDREEREKRIQENQDRMYELSRLRFQMDYGREPSVADWGRADVPGAQDSFGQGLQPGEAPIPQGTTPGWIPGLKQIQAGQQQTINTQKIKENQLDIQLKERKLQGSDYSENLGPAGSTYITKRLGGRKLNELRIDDKKDLRSLNSIIDWYEKNKFGSTEEALEEIRGGFNQGIYLKGQDFRGFDPDKDIYLPGEFGIDAFSVNKAVDLLQFAEEENLLFRTPSGAPPLPAGGKTSSAAGRTPSVKDEWDTAGMMEAFSNAFGGSGTAQEQDSRTPFSPTNDRIFGSQGNKKAPEQAWQKENAQMERLYDLSISKAQGAETLIEGNNFDKTPVMFTSDEMRAAQRRVDLFKDPAAKAILGIMEESNARASKAGYWIDEITGQMNRGGNKPSFFRDPKTGKMRRLPYIGLPF